MATMASILRERHLYYIEGGSGFIRFIQYTLPDYNSFTFISKKLRRYLKTNIKY